MLPSDHCTITNLIIPSANMSPSGLFHTAIPNKSCMNFWSSGFWLDWIKKYLVTWSKFEVHRAVSSASYQTNQKQFRRLYINFTSNVCALPIPTSGRGREEVYLYRTEVLPNILVTQLEIVFAYCRAMKYMYISVYNEGGTKVITVFKMSLEPLGAR